MKISIPGISMSLDTLYVVPDSLQRQFGFEINKAPCAIPLLSIDIKGLEAGVVAKNNPWDLQYRASLGGLYTMKSVNKFIV